MRVPLLDDVLLYQMFSFSMLGLVTCVRRPPKMVTNSLLRAVEVT